MTHPCVYCNTTENWVIIFQGLLNPTTHHSYYERRSCGLVDLIKTQIVCLDPEDLNQAVKRSHHHTPTLKEITHKFKGRTVFSKLDACHGYWSVVLDEESSYLTSTFNSSSGRFRFTRLPFGPCVRQDIFQQKMDFILEKCPGTVGIAADIAVHGPTGKEHTCKCQFAQPDASRAGARTSLQPRQMCY